MSKNGGVSTSTSTRKSRPAIRLDAVCAAAIAVARDALTEFTDVDNVGSHIATRAEAERVVTHMFEAYEPGYRGWYWSVTVMRAPRAKQVSVAEIALLPGSESLLPPEWLPWSERLRPGDLGVGDVLPTDVDDERLVPTYVLSDDPAVAEVEYELGLGRARVMSRTGRQQTAKRWWESDAGPHAAVARVAPANCGTCGFFLPLAGSMGGAFGACGNVMAPDDGKVVAVEHGCGAHSEALPAAGVVPDAIDEPDEPEGGPHEARP
ncbi:MAG: DUF3027 domain-containing protein [Corynebacteriales bacterium]|nr:DUF3027 domain-containing protein [Mycobacteriales bacterium]